MALAAGFGLSENDTIRFVSSNVLLRTLGVPGLLTDQYYEFFRANPLTYLSHVKVLNLFAPPYPYETHILFVIGEYFYDNPELTANAHFWASDGLVAFGLPGVLVVSLLCAGVFYVLDSAAARQHTGQVALTLLVSGVTLSNLNLFTTFFSGGLFAFIVLCWFSRPVSAEGPEHSGRRTVRRGSEHPSARPGRWVSFQS